MRALLLTCCCLVAGVPALAAITPFPAEIHTREIKTEGAVIHVRTGGQGSAVVMLHGFGDTGDKWAPLAVDVIKQHRIVIPDLRGMGLSSHPDS